MARGHGSGHERRRQRAQEERNKRRLIRALIGTGIGVLTTLIVLAISYAPGVSAASAVVVIPSGLVTTNTFVQTTSRQAGERAHVNLSVTGTAETKSFPATAMAPAHTDSGYELYAVCSLVMDSYSNRQVLATAIAGKVFLDETTQTMILFAPAAAYIHTGYFWNNEQPVNPMVEPLVNSQTLGIALLFDVDRFGKTGLAFESYELTLALVFTADGQISCSVFAPTAASRYPPLLNR